MPIITLKKESKPTITPKFNNVILRMLDREAVTEGGIIIPDRAQKTNVWGTVIAVGEDVKNIVPGEEAYVPSHLGTHYIDGGVDYIIIKEAQIIAKRQAGDREPIV